jgi:hypothetical protein
LVNFWHFLFLFYLLGCSFHFPVITVIDQIGHFRKSETGMLNEDQRVFLPTGCVLNSQVFYTLPTAHPDVEPLLICFFFIFYYIIKYYERKMTIQNWNTIKNLLVNYLVLYFITVKKTFGNESCNREHSGRTSVSYDSN